MIGLGSNRLTVCRRGGMSVTQAGRGGMEWLAGGRVPSWANPYSAQATAALKAQFPTQWPTILDYGVAHPALVPFINEDPMLVCSLMELGKIRELVASDGLSWIDPGFDLTSDLTFSYKTTASLRTGVHTGSNSIQSPAMFIAPSKSGSTYAIFISSWSSNNAVDTAYMQVELTSSQVVIKDANGTTKQTYSRGSNTISRHILLFASNGSNNYVYQANGRGTDAHFKNNSKEVYLVPFVSTTRNGMLDIHDLEHPTFYPNQGTGTFTTSETPAS